MANEAVGAYDSDLADEPVGADVDDRADVLVVDEAEPMKMRLEIMYFPLALLQSLF